MDAIFRPTTPSDRTPLSSLLAQAFVTHPSASLLDSAVMGWRYWDPRGDWVEPRSYVLEKSDRLIAHAGIWPLCFEGEKPSRGAQIIDWCAAKDSAGAGCTLVQKLATMFDFVYSIGGSEASRKMLPAMGFAEVTKTWTCARPLRPFHQILTHQAVNWKVAPRLIRNLLWSNSPSRRADVCWQTVTMQPSDTTGLIPINQSAFFSPRSPAFFEYLLRCPSIHYQLYGIRNQKGLEGYFALGVLRGQARVAGVWLRHACEQHWRMAYALAQQAALRFEGAYEIVATGSLGPSCQAAVRSGLRLVRNTPVYLLHKKSHFALPPDFQFQMSDDDSVFMDQGQASYYT